MLESGIGRAHNIHLSTLPNFTLPGDVAASRRYYAPDLIDPEIEVRRDGTIAVRTARASACTSSPIAWTPRHKNEWSSRRDDDTC